MKTKYHIIPEFPKYRIGNDGTLWSYRYIKNSYKKYRWKQITGKTKSHKGYVLATLHHNGKRRSVFLHVLVLEAFVGPCPSGLQACHEDDIKNNNQLGNLRWDTSSNNRKEAIRNGHYAKVINKSLYKERRGEKHKCSKLKVKDILTIRRLSKTLSQNQLAKKFQITRSGICSVLSRRSWKHV